MCLRLEATGELEAIRKDLREARREAEPVNRRPDDASHPAIRFDPPVREPVSAVPTAIR